MNQLLMILKILHHSEMRMVLILALQEKTIYDYMNPDVYEQYLSEGIRDQLREAITNSSFLSTIDKKLI